MQSPCAGPNAGPTALSPPSSAVTVYLFRYSGP